MFGLYQGVYYWAIRKKYFRYMSVSQIVKALFTMLLQLVFGFYKMGSYGLIIGYVFGQTVVTIPMVWYVRKLDGKLLKKVRYQKVVEQVKRFADFFKYSTPQALLSTVSNNLPALLLVFFFGPEIVGFYAISFRMLQAPVNLVGESFRQVFFQKVSQYYNDEMDVNALLIKATLGLSLVGIIPTLLIVVGGPAIFSFVLGGKWLTAGSFAQWLTIWLFFVLISPPANVIAQVFGKQKFLLFYDIVQLIFRTCSIIIGASLGKPIISIALYSITGVLFYILLMYKAFQWTQPRTGLS